LCDRTTCLKMLIVTVNLHAEMQHFEIH